MNKAHRKRFSHDAVDLLFEQKINTDGASQKTGIAVCTHSDSTRRRLSPDLSEEAG